jgi:hypothetical protein
MHGDSRAVRGRVEPCSVASVALPWVILMTTLIGMKSLPYIVGIVLCSMLVTASLAQESQPKDDPVDSFKELVASFPKQSVAKFSPDVTFNIEVADYDVKKTDSLVSPIVGLINFSTTHPIPFAPDETSTMNLQMVFGWKDGKWSFEKLLNTQNGKDFTNLAGGEELMGAGQMLDFLKPYRDQAQ